MAATAPNRGPWSHRLLIWGCTGALGILCYWLSGFVLDDIDAMRGPAYSEVEERMLDAKIADDVRRLDGDHAEVVRAIERERSRQLVLRDSTAGAQRTMNQLLDFQRAAVDKGVNPSPEEKQALAESQRIFLENEKRYQELNRQIAQLEDLQNELQKDQRIAEKRLADARVPIEAEFQRLWDQHRWKVAAVKLSFVLPLLALAAFALVKWRKTIYSPLIYAFGAAVVFQFGLVMHEHFPSQYFKYILILAPLLVVLRILVYLVRAVAYPKRDWLIRQYREAYERFLCPICEYPVRRGPLKYLFWTRRSVAKLPQSATTSAMLDEPYTCPHCAVKLFEECPVCKAQRHALLPACEHCGALKSLEDIAATTELTARP